MRIELRDGGRLETWVDYAYGEPENPVATRDLIEKFIDLSQLDTAGAWAEQILGLDAEPGLEPIEALSMAASQAETVSTSPPTICS